MSFTPRNPGFLGSRQIRAFRREVSVRPYLYIPLRLLRKPHTVVKRDTELVIEGFPRSGNTWTEAVIRHCAHEDIRLAHHSHAAAHVKHAVRLGVPTVVLFREPDAAVRSYLTLYDNDIDPRDGYLDYLRFYRATLPFKDRQVLFFSFEDTTERTTEMVRTMAEHFGLSLSWQDLEKERTRQDIVARMDAKAARLGRQGGRSDSLPGRVNDRKKQLQLAAKQAIEAPDVQHLRKEARALYTQSLLPLTRGKPA